MSDELTDAPIRSAFAELQATEPARFTPPGVAAAYRTVRRRRVTASTAASLTAVVLLGAGYLAGSGQAGPVLGPGPPPEAAASQGSLPPEEDPLGQLGVDRDLAMLAWEAVGQAPPGAFQAVGNTGLAAGAAVEEGTYLLRVGCAGDAGGVVVTGQVGPDEHLVTAQCGRTADQVEAGVGEIAIEVTGPGEIRLRVEPARPDGDQPAVAIAVIPQ